MISIDEGFMYNNIGWPYGTSQTVTTVIFDPSFADCRLKNLNSMFSGFTKLSNINGIEYLNTSEVTDMYLMFAYCYELKNIDLSNFNTSNSVRMYGMFEYCTSLTALDLSSFNTSKLRDISCMFYGDNALKTIYVGSGWNTSQIINPDSLDMVFKRCENLVGGKGTMYDESRYEYSDTDGAYARIDGSSGKPGYMTDINTRSAYAVLSDENTVMTLYYDGLKGVRGGINIGDWYSFTTSVRSVVFDESFASYTSLTSTSCWFSGFNYLESITGIEHLKTDNVTNMNQMFRGCSSLTNLDVSRFNTANVVDMSFMFGTCSKLTSLDVCGFNT
jgi:surface protein